MTRREAEDLPLEGEEEDDEVMMGRPVASALATPAARREEMTPGRRVTLPDEDAEAEIRRLTQQLHLTQAELTITQRERDRASGRAASRRLTERTSYASEEGPHAPRDRAKIEKPSTFSGGYKPLYNVLNWINDLEEYFEACNCYPESYVRYARSYMDGRVKAWFSARFPRTRASPTWDELVSALKKRYLDSNHGLQVELTFEHLRQTGGYSDYVDRAQVVDSALQLTGIAISQEKKVYRFITGLHLESDRLFLLEKRPKTLEECYEGIITLKQARSQAARRGAKDSRPQLWDPDKKKELNKLEGKAKEKAFAEGRCVICGREGHWAKGCPQLDKKIHRLMRERDKKRVGPKGGKGLRALFEPGDSSQEEEQEETEEDEEVPSGSEQSEEEGQAGQGNAQPGPQG